MFERKVLMEKSVPKREMTSIKAPFSKIVRKILHFKNKIENDSAKVENPGLAQIREARSAYLSACQKRTDIENEIGKNDSEISEASADCKKIRDAIESLRGASACPNALEVISSINIADKELNDAIMLAKNGIQISTAGAIKMLGRCLRESNARLSALNARKEILSKEFFAAREKERSLDIKISEKSSGHSDLVSEKAKKCHKGSILQIGEDVFTPQDAVGLELQLNNYLNCQKRLRSVDKVDIEILKKLNGLIRQEWFVFILNNEIVGFSGLEISFFEGPSEVVWLNWTGIAKPFQGNGIGKGMLEYIGTRAKAAGYDYLGVKTCHVYGPAIALYEKNGFKHAGEMSNYFGDGEPLLMYMKDLRHQ